MSASNGNGGRSRFGALLLIAAGVAALVYGKFSYTEESHTAQIGDIRMSVQDDRTVNIPVWAGVGAVIVGSLLLVLPTRKWVL
jgi:uncharacterized membrane protein YidH (DUF202 family)